MTRLASLALVGLLAVGCGGAPTRTLPNGSPVAVIDDSCAERIEPLYDELRDLDSRMNVGMNRPAYGERLGDIRVEYDKIVRGGPLETGACFATGIKLQDAMDEYIAANTRWGDCISDTSCTVDTDALPELQRRWATATRLLDEVELALP